MGFKFDLAFGLLALAATASSAGEAPSTSISPT